MEVNLQLVVSIARQYSQVDVHVLELIQTGNNALLAALDTFDGSSYDRFSGHAAACVEQAISEFRPSAP